MSSATLATPPLCIADDATFWPWRRWPEFSRWPDPDKTVVVVPLAGTADWGLGHPLDAEETALMSILRAASQSRPASLPLLVTPPLRFVLGPDAGCAFAVDAPLAHSFLSDVLGSIAVSGFKKVVLYNSSPWNEELIAAAARDNRIALGLQIFRISLSGLGLDLHPTRATPATRRKVQTLVTALLGREPDSSGTGVPPVSSDPSSSGTGVPPVILPAAPTWGDEAMRPLTEPAVALAAARIEADTTLAAAAKLLVSLLGEIQARPPLPHGGKIVPAQP